MSATRSQQAWSAGKFNDPVAPLSGFELITQGIPQDLWLSTPQVLDYINAYFETRYVPEWCIAALGLKFSDPSLNGYGKKHTGLVQETTLISFDEMTPEDIASASYTMEEAGK